MKKTLLAIAASAVLAVATLAPTTADARCRGCGVGLGIVGGLAAGAIIGGAIANSPAYAYPRAYYPVAGYEPYPRMARRRPMAAPAATGRAVRSAIPTATWSAGAVRASSARRLISTQLI